MSLVRFRNMDGLDMTPVREIEMKKENQFIMILYCLLEIRKWISAYSWLFPLIVNKKVLPLRLAMLRYNGVLNLQLPTDRDQLPRLLWGSLPCSKFGVLSELEFSSEVWYPNLFLDGPISIHGVLGLSSALDPSDVNQGWDIILSSACDSNSNIVYDVKNMVEWSQIILLLGSKGFVSFVVRLNSVLDRCSGISCAAMASWACWAPYKAAGSRKLVNCGRS